MKHKYIINILKIAVVIFLFDFIACKKKGEQDPLISLRSRKARLTGEWDVDKLKVNGKDIFTSIVNQITFNDGCEYMYFKGSLSGTIEMEFEDDGDYQRVVAGKLNNCSYDINDCGDIYNYDYCDNSKISILDNYYKYYGGDGHFTKGGDWDFEEKKEKLEIKDRNGNVEIYDIIGLSNKALHLKGSIDWDGDGNNETVEIEASK